MRVLILIATLFSFSTLKAQIALPGSFAGYAQNTGFANNTHLGDSLSVKKWSLNRYSGISASYSFFNGGSANIIAAPIGLQLNRRLNNNLYAFANVSIAPAYVHFNRSFITTDFNKANPSGGFYNTNSLNLYSSASVGLQYVNDDKTFSISGSFSVQKSSYPTLPYYPMNNKKPDPVMPVNNR
ncbi:MAG TPA: hypothetical protein VFV68_04890 [Agriterribacter sp.]|nr:hypothetical protein [Agriterribacter sp.]